MIVADASVAVKLVIKEADSARAHGWFRGVDAPVVAPDLIAIEVAQAIVRRVNARDVAREQGRTTLGNWRALLDYGLIELQRIDSDQMEVAAEIAMRIGHPVKDCVYLALALERKAILLTCDARFAAKAKTEFSCVRLLADLSPS